MRALFAEMRHLGRDRWDLGVLTALPAVLVILVSAMLIQGVPRQLPIAIVDEDGSSLSRAIIRDVEASPTVRVTWMGGQIAPAFHRVRKEDAWAVLRIPHGLEDGLEHRPPPAIQIFYQGSFLSMGSVVSRAIEAAVTASLIAHLPVTPSSHGLPGIRLHPPTVQATILKNPSTSFEWYLTVLIDPAVLHLLVACMTVVALGREIENKSLAGWAVRSGNVGAALVGKMLPYVLVATIWGTLWLIWITWFRSWPVNGSLMLLVLGQALLFAGTAGISSLLVVATGDIGTGLSASAIYAGSALAYSGATLPLQGGNGFARIWSQMLPLTHYIRMQMGQYLDAPLRTALPELGLLLLYALMCGGVSVLLLRVRVAKA
ncbi:ABC transporter permease [Sphingomonas abietis]|uniref:ABC transporter permease n=1 Tax=Sphingomonas abietis TaxID=3012344 RepID=A0ABY7NR69_9SPHN|nr:ABC transporter permease [Sphingomonas abietis]WBO23883.1 ABC transporter permease [Sphingomonas abietis]